MRTIKNFLEIESQELDTWVRAPHVYNFFKIVYIESGHGMQCINKNKFEYNSGNIFLLPPLNCHSYEIYETTKFYSLRFHDQYFQQKQFLTNYKAWFEKISYILANYNRVPGDIIESQEDRNYIISSMKSIHKEYTSPDSYSDDIISGAVASILNILARNIENKYLNGVHSNGRFSEILRHINNNILTQEELKISVLADRFGISQGYFSQYFKKEAGMNLAEYIIKAKLRLAETYILHTDQSLKEIAFELNFADSSHLSNTFKRNYGMTVKEFRQVTGNARCETLGN